MNNQTVNNRHATGSSLAGPACTARRGGFTLMEMIVVIVILLTLLTLVLPAFVSIKKSSEYSISQELVKQAVRDAHGRAISARYDTAVVFTFSPDQGIQMVPCNMLGTIIDGNLANPSDPNDPKVTRDVFAPVTSRKAISLPAGISVRGFAGAFKVDSHWYEPVPDGGQRYQPDQPAWVFPETDFYSRQVRSGAAATATDVGRNRQTFMVRFAARTGQLVPSEAAAAVVVLPRLSATGRENGLAAVTRFDTATDVSALTASVLDRVDWPGLGVSKPRGQLDLLGDASSDTVLVRSVTRLAVHRERELAQALGMPLDPVTQTLYELPTDWQTRTDVVPRYIPALRVIGTTPLSVYRWFEGFAVLGDASGTVKTTGARPIVYSIHPLRGEAIEESAQ